MKQAEQAGHQHRCRPEADSGSERELKISAKCEFFKQANHQERDAPPGKRRQNCCPVQSKSGNTESMKQEHRQQRTADSRKAAQRSDPKVFSQGLTRGQPVFAESAM